MLDPLLKSKIIYILCYSTHAIIQYPQHLYIEIGYTTNSISDVGNDQLVRRRIQVGETGGFNQESVRNTDSFGDDWLNKLYVTNTDRVSVLGESEDFALLLSASQPQLHHLEKQYMCHNNYPSCQNAGHFSCLIFKKGRNFTS